MVYQRRHDILNCCIKCSSANNKKETLIKQSKKIKNRNVKTKLSSKIKQSKHKKYNVI